MSKINNLPSYYLPDMPLYLVYILQQTDYDLARFIRILSSFQKLGSIKKRGKITLTSKVKALLFIGYLVYILHIFGFIFSLVNSSYLLAVLFILLIPIGCIIILSLVVFIANLLLSSKRKNYILNTGNKLGNNDSYKIAILGSYGKTTMKEIILKVLSDHFSIAGTPGNQNIPISISKWINNRHNKEQILVFEFGESKPGDISELAELTHPDFAFITGLAPNHLDTYKSMESLEKDIGSIAKYVEPNNIFVNQQAMNNLSDYLKADTLSYSNSGIGDWTVNNIQVSINGLEFDIKNKQESYHLNSNLLGRHNIGPLVAAFYIAIKLGMPKKAVVNSISKTEPFEHRMKPRELHGAWMIDDTYNGNFEGFLAGLDLLKELDANRKIYITPGLVEQGKETKRVHNEIGKAIAKTNPDIVVLMNNSVTEYILEGLNEQKYSGSIKIEDDPLAFYQKIDQFIAKGDIVLMQNDWPDGYQ